MALKSQTNRDVTSTCHTIVNLVVDGSRQACVFFLTSRIKWKKLLYTFTFRKIVPRTSLFRVSGLFFIGKWHAWPQDLVPPPTPRPLDWRHSRHLASVTCCQATQHALGRDRMIQINIHMYTIIYSIIYHFLTLPLTRYSCYAYWIMNW